MKSLACRIQGNYFGAPVFFESTSPFRQKKKNLSTAAFDIGIGIMYSASFKKSRDPGFERQNSRSSSSFSNMELLKH